MSQIGSLKERLDGLFRPHSVALVGATDNSRWSLNTFQNLQQCGFSGPVYLVHPRHRHVHGQRAYASLQELPERPDLLYVMVPADVVTGVIKEAGEMGIHYAVVLTAGFSETGPEGARLEAHLHLLALRYDMIILGPNGNGFINSQAGIVPYGLLVTPPLRRGPVGLILQSGALASTALGFARNHAIGLSLLVSMGNEMMVACTDVMEYLIDDPATRVIALFLESIRDAGAFRHAAQRAFQAGKPVVALKVGKSSVSQRTAMAHTGALVGNDAVNAAALRQFGVIRVESVEDLLLTAGFLGSAPPLTGTRMGVITPSGGASDIVADRADEEGLQLPDFSPGVKARLRTVVPSFATLHNPLDVTGYVVVDPSLTRRALEVAVDDENFDFLLTFVTLPTHRSPNPERFRAAFRALGELKAKANKPLLAATETLTDIPELAQEMIEAADIQVLGGIEHGLRVLRRAVWWHQRRRLATEEVGPPRRVLLDLGPQRPEGVWGEWRARHLLEAAGIPVTPAALARNPQECRMIAERIGYPVVLKIASDEVVHKSDVGGVVLDIRDPEAVEGAAEDLLRRLRNAALGANIEGILIEPMRRQGHELLVSLSRDPGWGVVLTVALGGIWVEIFQDRAIRVLPVSRGEVRVMLDELRGSRVLKGGRGQPQADVERLTDVIFSLGQLAESLGDHLDTLEINPLWVSGHTIEVLDALIVWRQPSQEEAQ